MGFDQQNGVETADFQLNRNGLPGFNLIEEWKASPSRGDSTVAAGTTMPRPSADNFDFVGTGGTSSMRRSEDGALTFTTPQQRLTSFDGRTWISETGDVVFQGTIGMENGNLVRQNNYGVRTIERPDGSETRSIRTTDGNTIVMNTSAIPNGGTAADRTITITDTTGTYRSTDGGRSFVGIDGEGRFNGAVVDGAMGIDNYGNYWHTNSWQPNEHIVDARTPEAQRHYERRREIEMRFGVTIAPADVSYSSPPASL